jgi:hypothetical protein
MRIEKIAAAVVSGMFYRESFADRPVIRRSQRATDKSGINASVTPTNVMAADNSKVEPNSDVSQK